MNGGESGNLVVLYVDTDPDRQSTVTRRLTEDGMAVESVRSGAAALDAVSTADVDCVVTEHALPERDGLALFEAVRERDPHLPVVLFTDAGDERVAGEAVSAGVAAYVPKGRPDAVETLTAEIRSAVEHARREMALAEREQRYRTLVRGSHDGIYIYRDDEFLFVDERVAEITGYDRTELREMEVWDLLHPEDEGRVRRLAQDRLDDGDAPSTYEGRVVTASGETRYLEFSVGIVTYEGDEAVLGSVRDITERRRREAELVRYRTIVEAVGDPVYTLDESGQITLINEALTDITGYGEDELLGEHVSTLMRAEDVETAQSLIEELVESDERQRATFEMEAVTADGEHIPCEDHIALLPSEDGFRGTAGVVRDITERTERTARLRRQNERLDQFASVVSHDLRNPLNVIMGRVDLARQSDDPEHLDAIERSAERMERLVDDLLALAREGQTVGETAAVPLEPVVRRAWRNVETSDAALAVPDELGTVVADDTRLTSLFENLFRNAVEHGSAGSRVEPDDGVQPGAAVEATAEGSAVERHSGRDHHEDPPVTVTVGILPERDGFYVADDGPGIPPDERDTIFEEGYTTSRDGTGLGLVIVESIADAHSWSVAVTESETGGARFEVSGVDRSPD